jgi:hypothetical protein
MESVRLGLLGHRQHLHDGAKTTAKFIQNRNPKVDMALQIKTKSHSWAAALSFASASDSKSSKAHPARQHAGGRNNTANGQSVVLFKGLN